jgi:hypothetical protein
MILQDVVHKLDEYNNDSTGSWLWRTGCFMKLFEKVQKRGTRGSARLKYL